MTIDGLVTCHSKQMAEKVIQRLRERFPNLHFQTIRCHGEIEINCNSGANAVLREAAIEIIREEEEFWTSH